MGRKLEPAGYGAINLHEGKVGVGLVYATLIPDCGRAKMYADKLLRWCPVLSSKFAAPALARSTMKRAGQAGGIGMERRGAFFSSLAPGGRSAEADPRSGNAAALVISRRMECGNIAIPRSLRCRRRLYVVGFKRPHKRAASLHPLRNLVFRASVWLWSENRHRQSYQSQNTARSKKNL